MGVGWSLVGQDAGRTDLHVLQLTGWARHRLAQGHFPFVQIAAGISSAL